MTGKTPADALADLGRALYGDQWQGALARALSIHVRDLRRYLTGQKPLAATDPIFADALVHARNMAVSANRGADALVAWMAANGWACGSRSRRA